MEHLLMNPIEEYIEIYSISVSLVVYLIAEHLEVYPIAGIHDPIVRVKFNPMNISIR